MIVSVVLGLSNARLAEYDPATTTTHKTNSNVTLVKPFIFSPLLILWVLKVLGGIISQELKCSSPKTEQKTDLTS
jgi:hypothetical protein